jgi:Ca-activated chloride channel homolog
MVRRARWIVVLLSVAAGCTPIEAESNEPAQRVEPREPVGAVEPRVRDLADSHDSNAQVDGSLEVEVLPRFRSVLVGQAGTMDVLVRIRGLEQPGLERPPLDLAIVLDRSGSMSGDKILAVKEAALETLRKLEEGDRITVVTYDHEVVLQAERVLAGSPEAKRLKGQLLGIDARGGTALGPALRRGLDVLEGAKRKPDVLAHLMLLSDGLANEGEQRPTVLSEWAANGFRKGIGVSTLGVGLDYAEDLMTRIADAGGGRYHFIERSDQVGEVLADEFAGLTATVARNVTLAVAPEGGLEVKEIPGYVTERDEKAMSARVGTMAAGGKRELLVRMRYAAPKGREMALGTFTVEFRDAMADGAPRTITAQPTVALTHDAKIVEKGEDYAVTVRAVELEVAAAMHQASQDVEHGRYEAAREVLHQARDEVRRKAAATPELALDPMVEELEDAEKKIETAKRSVEERKLYQKSFKAKAYGKGKK